MRLALCLPLFLLLAACGSGGLPPLPADRVTARFPPHGLANVIVVEALTRLPLRRAELVAPDGATTASGPITIDPAPRATSYQDIASRPYGGSLAGIGARQSMLSSAPGAAPQSESRLLEMHATAAIALPDPLAYRRDWRHYQIRLRFGTPPAPVESEVIAAPAPPPAG
jgi:hypothetical protein